MGSNSHVMIAPKVQRHKPAAEALTHSRRRLLVTILACFLAVVAVGRIVSTYHVFSQSTDEPDSVAPGMEWLQYGTYTFEPLHPPLARVAASIGLYLYGLRLKDHRNLWIEGNEILFSNGRYLHNLALARAGILPFFLLATFQVWYWGRSRYGDTPALIAVFLFTTTPIVLGHAGMATTDTAEAATFTLAVFAFVNFLERQTLPRAAIVGATSGLAIIAKFSGLPFLAASFAALLLCRWLLSKRSKVDSPSMGASGWIRASSLAAVMACLVIWAGYRFSVSSATTPADRPHYTIDQMIGTHGALHDVAYRVAEMPFVPAPAFFQGLAKIRFKNYQGHKSYLLGEVRQTGWWYFFPVAFAVKTTIPFMILAAVGGFYLCRSGWRECNWVIVVPVVASVAVFLVCLKSQINIGVRHLLPIYPLLSIVGAVGAYRLWQNTTREYVARSVVLFLLAWQLLASIRSHPDYLAYFNEFAGSHPEKILIDSDLDWGQDLLRLSNALQERHIQQVSIAYAGSKNLDLNNFALPSFRVLPPHQPATGWIAISLFCLKVGELGEPVDGYSWLDAYQPAGMVGRSIRLYYVQPSSQQRVAANVKNLN